MKIYILIDVYDNRVIYNEKYKDLEEAKSDLDAEFYYSTCDDRTLEYEKECWESDDGMSAWAIINGKYRIWHITEVFS